MSWGDIIKAKKYPNVEREIDYKISNFSHKPMSSIPKLVSEAIKLFGEGLEQDIEDSFIDNRAYPENYTPRHKKFNNWLKTLWRRDYNEWRN